MDLLVPMAFTRKLGTDETEDGDSASIIMLAAISRSTQDGRVTG